MTKAQLIAVLTARHPHLAPADVEVSAKQMLRQLSEAMMRGERIEVRGFGSFALHYRAPRMARNPKTGAAVASPGKHVPHFKPSKALRNGVNVFGI